MLTQATTASPNAIQAPATREEFIIQIAKREELTNQLTSLSETMQRLIDQRDHASARLNQAGLADLDTRIAELGQRIVRIEREKLATDDAIAAAISRGVATGDMPPVPGGPTPGLPQIPGVPGFPFDEGAVREEYREMMLIEAATFILVGIVAWRWMKRRWQRQRARELTGESAATKELKDAVFAIAVEVERISENQRFVTKLLSERPQAERALVERGPADRA